MTGWVGIGLVGLWMWGWRIAAAGARTQGVHLASCFARNEQAQRETSADVDCRTLGVGRGAPGASRCRGRPRRHFANLEYRTDMSFWPEAERMEEATTVSLDRGDRSKAVPFEGRDMVVDELEELGRCVRDGTPPETGAAEGMAGFRVPDPWIVASVEDGRTAQVDGERSTGERSG